MKICPAHDCECPYFRVELDDYGEADCYCELPHPEEDCDDYFYLMGDEDRG